MVRHRPCRGVHRDFKGIPPRQKSASFSSTGHREDDRGVGGEGIERAGRSITEVSGMPRQTHEDRPQARPAVASRNTRQAVVRGVESARRRPGGLGRGQLPARHASSTLTWRARLNLERQRLAHGSTPSSAVAVAADGRHHVWTRSQRETSRVANQAAVDGAERIREAIGGLAHRGPGPNLDQAGRHAVPGGAIAA